MALPAIAAVLARIGLTSGARAAAGAGARQGATKAAGGAAAKEGGKRGFGEVIGGMLDRIMVARAASGGGSPGTPKGKDGNDEGGPERRDFEEALSSGSSFGDMMAGKTTLADEAKRAEESRKVAEGEEELAKQTDKLSGAFKKVGVVVAALPLAVAGAVKALHAISYAWLERQRSLSDYSGSINAAFAQLERNRVVRDISKARGTSGSATQLADSLNELEEAILPYQIAATNFFNNILSTLNRGVAMVQAGMEQIPILRGIGERIAEYLEAEDVPIEAPAQARFLNQIADGDFDAATDERRVGGYGE